MRPKALFTLVFNYMGPSGGALQSAKVTTCKPSIHGQSFTGNCCMSVYMRSTANCCGTYQPHIAFKGVADLQLFTGELLLGFPQQI